MATDGDFVLRVSSAGRLLGASDSVADVLGWDVERCAAEGLCAEISDKAQRVVARQFLAQVLAQGRARSTVQLSAGAQRLWLDVAGKHLVGEPGTPIHISARDVSHDLELAARLAASERQWRVAFEHSPIGGALLDGVGGILVANEALPRMVGWPLHQLTRLNVIDIVDCEGGLPWQSWWEGLSLPRPPPTPRNDGSAPSTGRRSGLGSPAHW